MNIIFGQRLLEVSKKLKIFLDNSKIKVPPNIPKTKQYFSVLSLLSYIIRGLFMDNMEMITRANR